MKRPIATITLIFFSLFILAQNKPSIHSYTASTIEGQVISLSKYHGKKLMLVNTASYCSYTPQYKDLEELYKGYKQYNFEILGFPCNDFGNQDPGKDSTINVFCSTNYGVSFQMMSKIKIAAGDTSPIYKWLQRKNLNGVQDTAVNWNFNKFLINESGNWVKYYNSPVSPLDSRIKNWILSPSSLSGINDFDPSIADLLRYNAEKSCVELVINQASTLPLQLSLYTIEGQLIRRATTSVAGPSAKIDFEVGELPNGIYLLNASNGVKQSHLRFSILK